ncbi:MAG: lactate utilization protein C, partial [Pseudomonadota bacterium]
VRDMRHFDVRAKRFCERAQALASTVDEAGWAEVPARVAAYLRQHALPMQLVCWDEFTELDWSGAGIRAQARAACGDDLVGLTGACCGIAETGTLMMLSGASTPPSVSLLPETHIAVLSASRIVRSMEDAWALLRGAVTGIPRAVSFISGPSRTADIEQTVTLGAHGPYRVHILITD